jgi:hypothetical protein
VLDHCTIGAAFFKGWRKNLSSLSRHAGWRASATFGRMLDKFCFANASLKTLAKSTTFALLGRACFAKITAVNKYFHFAR